MKVEDVLVKDYVTGRNARISVTFNKLVRTQEYESERVEAQIDFDLQDGENMELALLEAQTLLEYSIMTQLLAKRQISQEDFTLRKQELEDSLRLMENKLQSLSVPQQ